MKYCKRYLPSSHLLYHDSMLRTDRHLLYMGDNSIPKHYCVEYFLYFCLSMRVGFYFKELKPRLSVNISGERGFS